MSIRCEWMKTAAIRVIPYSALAAHAIHSQTFPTTTAIQVDFEAFQPCWWGVITKRKEEGKKGKERKRGRRKRERRKRERKGEKITFPQP